MYLYNVTIKIREDIHKEWLLWLQQKHIPEVISTGCFLSASVFRLLEIDDSEGPTYAVQYRAESKAKYNQYIELFANDMRQRSYEKWGDQFIAFRTLMQVVN
jgi:hypothetical protein